MSHKELSQKIQFEIEQLDNNFNSFKELFDLAEIKEPELVELAAMSTIINSFYMGVERIMKAIAKLIDNFVPQGERWHKELLLQMKNPNEKRVYVISENMFNELINYLSFRHFQRNSYEYILNWTALKPLFLNLKQTWEQFKLEINHFILPYK